MINRFVLGALAVVLMAIGAGAAFAPGVFYASYDVSIDGLPNLASELRGTGGALFLLGFAVAAGAVWSTWAFPAAVIAGLVFAGYAFGRAISALADGMASEATVIAGVVEIALAIAAAWVIVRTRPRPE
jgi:hypothetical protein